eukprot:Phypoly_transcript_17108.p1 GENE.Phypoly_transcript_17108~~Phypoly_transcript_17108.p1  ORF type:complete len:182 (+),score=18.65 Phypoly_transcript_17108:118-663(+)
MSTTETTTPTTGVKRDASSLDDQQHFWELIKDFKEVFLLSRSADGNEHGRPMHIVSAHPDEGIYFFTPLNSPKVQEIKQDDHITITGQASSKWVYCIGKACLITDKAKISEKWTEGVRPWFPEGTNDSDVSLLCIKPERGMPRVRRVKDAFKKQQEYYHARLIYSYIFRRVLGSVHTLQQG